MDALERAIEAHGAAAYVSIGSSTCDADIRYLTGFRISDPVVFILRKGVPARIVVSSMEYARAQREAKVSAITRNEAGFFELLKDEGGDRTRATARMIVSLVDGDVIVPEHFPIALGRALESHVRVGIEGDGVVKRAREVKKAAEIRAIVRAQRAAEEAMKAATGMIARSRARNGRLFLERRPLTSERVKNAIHRILLERGCMARDTIVSCGRDAALPHHTGAGPLLEDEPIVIDIFPQEESTGYYADMTRTVVKGEPSPEVMEMYDAVREAKAIAIQAVRAGADGGEIHQRVVDLFSSRGYESGQRGFMHNLGHGVGLEVHELPTLGPGGGRLRAGSVVTIEPGLYCEEAGGVRLEDMGVVRRGGFLNLTSFEERCAL